MLRSLVARVRNVSNPSIATALQRNMINEELSPGALFYSVHAYMCRFTWMGLRIVSGVPSGIIVFLTVLEIGRMLISY